MECPSCKARDEIQAIFSVRVVAPLAKKGGSIKTAGVKVTQIDIKDAWNKDPISEEERMIRGPLICMNCDAELVYVVKSDNPLREMTLDEAEEAGYDALV